MTRWAGGRVERFVEIDSTNRVAKQSALPHGTLFLAERQTGGRGRSGRSWQSDAGLGIYSTLLLRPDNLSPQNASRITQLAAVAVAEGLRAFGLDALIKWPNDIVIGGRKICGILCESVLSGATVAKIVIGAGINHLQFPQDFDPSFRDHAVSLRMLLPETPSAESVLAEYLLSIEKHYQNALSGNLLPLYKALSATIGQEVRVLSEKGDWVGFASDLLDDGALVVKTADGYEKTVYAGDVSVRGLMGYG